MGIVVGYYIMVYFFCLTDLTNTHPAMIFANMKIIPNQFWKYLYFKDRMWKEGVF